MDRVGGLGDAEREKLVAEKAYYGEKAIPRVGAGQVVNECNSQMATTAERHPREYLLDDIKDQEQKLLDKLVTLRELRQEFMFLGREEAGRIVKVSQLAERLRY